LNLQPASALAQYFFGYVYLDVLEFVLLAWAVLVCLHFRAIRDVLRARVSRAGAAGAAALFGAALFLRLGAFPPRHQVYFDEFVHMDIAANVARGNVFAESLAGGAADIRAVQVPAWPGGFHLLLGSVYKFAGASQATAFRFNAALGALSAPLLFLLTTLLFDDESAGLLAAFFLTVLPIHLRFSAATDLTVCAGFWLLAALLSLAIFLRRPGGGLFALFLASTLYAVNVRFENLVLIPFAAAVLVHERKRLSFGLATAALLAVFVLLLLPTAALVLRDRGVGTPGFADPAGEMLRHLLTNLASNVWFLLREPSTSAVLLPAVVYGVWKARREDMTSICAPAGLALGYVVVCSLHARADYNVGSSERFSLPVLLCLIVAACGGLKAVLARLGSEQPIGAGALAVAFVALSLSEYGRGPLDRYEQEYRLVVATRDALPPDDYVISYCAPLIVSVAGRPSVGAFLLPLGGADLLDRLDARGTRPVFLFKDVFWYREAELSARVEELLKARYRFETLVEAPIDGRTYGFYRLTRRP